MDISDSSDFAARQSGKPLPVGGDSYALVIPVYQRSLSAIEEKRVAFSIHNANCDVFFVGPQSLPRDYYSKLSPNSLQLAFSDNHFASVRTYSDWLLGPELYEALIDYDLLLLCQPDAILVKPLSELITDYRDWDYIGAPWRPGFRFSWNPFTFELKRNSWRLTERRLYVGNGGLSLRRSKKFLRASKIMKRVRNANEDIVIAYFGPNLGIRVAPPEIAAEVFMEKGALDWAVGDPIPEIFGFHGLERQNPALDKAILASL